MGHRDVSGLLAQARALVAEGDRVAVHLDARAGRAATRALRDGLRDLPGALPAPRQIRCNWGGWSLVRAALITLRAARDAFPDASHFYLISGDCRPVKPGIQIRQMLSDTDQDWIEAQDFLTSDWIKTGMKDERLIYRHMFNERRQTRAFYASLRLQKRLGLTRRPPRDLRIRIGSQWWCLRRDTVDRVLRFCRKRRDVMRFFATTWIPDESFFQTLVHHLVPQDQISGRSPTFLMFSDYGLPVAFHDDHADLLMRQTAFFARKICPDAGGLRARLDALYADPHPIRDLADDGTRHLQVLANLGRHGARHAPRIWQSGSDIGQGRDVLVICCKKRHVARQMAHAIAPKVGRPAFGYLFHEDDSDLPDLGGLERGLDKRNRHRRAFLGLLCDRLGSDGLILCADPSDLDLLRDLARDAARLRILQIRCDLSLRYMKGHADRLGLPCADPGTLRALRRGIIAEEDALAAADLAPLSVMSDTDPQSAQVSALASVLAGALTGARAGVQGWDPQGAQDLLQGLAPDQD